MGKFVMDKKLKILIETVLITIIILPTIAGIFSGLIPIVPRNVVAQLISFSVVNIIPTTSQYEGTSATVYCDGSQCCSSVWGCPNMWAPVRIGNAIMDPNVWGFEDLYRTNPSQVGIGSTTMTIRNGIVEVVSQWRINTAPRYGTPAYHEVIYGAKPWGSSIVNAPNFQLPMRVSDSPRILVGVHPQLISGRPGINFAFEAWIFRDADNSRAPTTGDYEIMVQLYMYNGVPAGSKVAKYTVPIIVDGRVVNQVFELYLSTSAGHTFYTFKSTTNYANNHVVFDYTRFIEIINEREGGKLSNMYIMSLEFGTEVYTIACSSYPCDIDVRWSLNRYYFALAPRSVATEEALNAWAQILAGTTTPVTITITSISPTTITTTVKETVIPIEYVVTIVIAVVILAIAMAYILRMRKRQ
ncbi:glycoside hydrolase family 12 [Ignisphaera aggregans DSM 17230]|uniref:Glycoside hydrolase family 12 n=1 Tax=Ignisphaera aggregans (strain DSM 17230 / JCM 13409 / AQ1.S1) TaxID=583356 RepID=E0SSS1_IGNAA|nr:glycoside hydrolase family 12 [Ignisphaera aggregans DSM 17230]